MTDTERGTRRLAQEVSGRSSSAAAPTRARLTVPQVKRAPRATSPWVEAALGVALDRISGSSFVVAPQGRVAQANTAGRALLRADRASTEARIAASAQRFAISGPGRRGYEIVVLEPSEGEADVRAQAVGEALGLSPRESQVLGLVAIGLSNRLIGLELGCAEKTVEAHVSSILAATGCSSRTSLVARFWTHSLRSA